MQCCSIILVAFILSLNTKTLYVHVRTECFTRFRTVVTYRLIFFLCQTVELVANCSFRRF